MKKNKEVEKLRSQTNKSLDFIINRLAKHEKEIEQLQTMFNMVQPGHKMDSFDRGMIQ